PTIAPASRSGAAARPSACPCRCGSGTRCRPCRASLPQSVLMADIAPRVPDARRHDRIERLVGRGHGTARADGIAPCRSGGLRFTAGLQGPRGAHQQLAELDDRHIGRTEMLPGAVLDRTHAVLDRGVLLAHAFDAGEGLVLLDLAIEQVVVARIADRNVAVVDLGVDVEAVI